MLATFTIEILFAVYILWRYKLTPLSRIVVAILVSLAVFQGAEYAVCGAAVEPGIWSRIGYSSISLLPALGLHLILTIAKQKKSYIVMAGYASAAAFVLYYTFATHAISGSTCYANYAVFGPSEFIGWYYVAYYYGLMILGIALAWYYASRQKKQRSALIAVIVGYLSFILPTATVNIIDPTTIAGISSIMCGFAVLFAFVLTTTVAPLTLRRKK